MAFIKTKIMKKLFFISLFCISSMCYAQEKAKWHVEFEKAGAISIETKKPLMVLFTGSDWCPPCKNLKRKVFNSDLFKDWADKNVVLVELDFPRRKEQKEEIRIQNKNLQNIFKVSSYPQVHFVSFSKVEDKNLNHHGKIVGGSPLDPAKWIQQANLYLKNIK